MSERFVPAIDAPPAGDAPPASDAAAWWFAFRDGALLVVGEEMAAVATVPMATDLAEVGIEPVRRQFLGTIDGRPTWSAELGAAVEPPAGWSFHGLRELHGRLDETVWAVAGRAAQIVAWDRDHRFCGRCGTATAPVAGERARRCPTCGLTAFPRVSPAVIVLIERGDQILLARGHRSLPGRYGIVAGFVEAGESLEEAVRREVREEVRLEIADVRYFGSQPWPFPHGVMIGFTARHAAGEIVLQDAELLEAGWFAIDGLPRVPPKLSIARRLIDAWAARQGREVTDGW